MIRPAALLLVALAAPAAAFDDGDRIAIETEIASFRTAFETGDWPGILPPDGIIAEMARLAGSTPEAIRAEALATLDDVMRRVDIRSFEFHTDEMTTGTAPSGADYAFIPSTLTMSIDGGPAQSGGSLVMAAELDEGWRLFRLESWQHWALFLRAYPQFEGVERPE